MAYRVNFIEVKLKGSAQNVSPLKNSIAYNCFVNNQNQAKTFDNMMTQNLYDIIISNELLSLG